MAAVETSKWNTIHFSTNKYLLSPIISWQSLGRALGLEKYVFQYPLYWNFSVDLHVPI